MDKVDTVVLPIISPAQICSFLVFVSSLDGPHNFSQYLFGDDDLSLISVF